MVANLWLLISKTYTEYYLKHEYRSVLSDIKREAQPSVLCLIKHDNECFE
jgi:hypothetical protein